MAGPIAQTSSMGKTLKDQAKIKGALGALAWCGPQTAASLLLSSGKTPHEIAQLLITYTKKRVSGTNKDDKITWLKNVLAVLNDRNEDLLSKVAKEMDEIDIFALAAVTDKIRLKDIKENNRSAERLLKTLEKCQNNNLSESGNKKTSPNEGGGN